MISERPVSTSTKVTITCPPPQTWREFNHGRLSDERSAELTDHLSSCRDCTQFASALSKVADPFIASLNSLADDYGNEAFLQELTHTLSRSPCELSGWTGAEEALGSERRLQDDVPREIDEYRILEPLGDGAAGRVFKARHKRLEKLVAIKILAPRRGITPDLVERFEREMRAVGRIDHPNVIGATDAGEADGFYFLVMDCLEGLDASRVVAGSERLPVAEACEIVRQAALGIHAAHEHDLIHRDVKPSNLLVTDDGVVKVLDLGLVRLGRSTHRNRTGKVVGTPQFMAPEQWRGEHVDERTDVYGLGGTLFKFLCGVAPYDLSEEGPPKEMNGTEEQATPPSVTDHCRDVPSEVAAIVAQSLAICPQERIASAQELARRLGKHTLGADLPGLVRRARIAALGDTLHGAEDVTQPEPVSSADSRQFKRLRVGAIALKSFILAGAIVGFVYALGPREILTWRKVVAEDNVPEYRDGQAPPVIHVSSRRNEPGITIDGAGRTLLAVGESDVDFYAIRTRLSARGDTIAGVYFAASPMTRAGFDCFFVQLRRVESPPGIDVQLYHFDYKRRDGAMFGPTCLAVDVGHAHVMPNPASLELMVRVFPGHVGVYVDSVRVMQVPMARLAVHRKPQTAGMCGVYGVLTENGRASFDQVQYLRQ